MAIWLSLASQLLPVVRLAEQMLYPLSLLPAPCNLKPTNAGAQRHPLVILAHMRQEDQPGLHSERPSRQKIDQALVCGSGVIYSEPIGLWIRLPDPLLGGCFLSQCLSIRKALRSSYLCLPRQPMPPRPPTSSAPSGGRGLPLTDMTSIRSHC